MARQSKERKIMEIERTATAFDVPTPANLDKLSYTQLKLILQSLYKNKFNPNKETV